MEYVPRDQLTEAGGRIEVMAETAGETMTVEASEVLIAAGRQPNTDRIGLDRTAVETDENGFIKVDKQFQTAEDTIWALEDVIDGPMFTHSARDDAALLYRHLVHDEEIDADDRYVPRAVFTDPSVGCVGLTKKQAQNWGHDVTVGRSKYAEQGKPKALCETEASQKSSPMPTRGRSSDVTSSGRAAPASSTRSSWRWNSAGWPTTLQMRPISIRRCQKS